MRYTGTSYFVIFCALCLSLLSRKASPLTRTPERNMTDESKSNLKAFPPPESGQSRYVIHMPRIEDEHGLKIELIIGKEVEVDPVNHHFFVGHLQEVNVDGWGFTRYLISELGPMTGTLMAVLPDQPAVRKFVPVHGETALLRYNSRLPIVVYVPEGVLVKYRIWRADHLSETADIQ
ncbi:hypothetical protein CEUSTIGMA_g9497.t1 [Chlamydomonas eustigma]|uniref:Ecotin n=1 Tax=Chlamydomonas eustigma TaxID=1157962 RepID=A0A250XGN3_9CHLO|nr:hypothetical protein CEUSTIGMA_g9497.t1 [Chlamydomonas eustigma]|eukprot:GAX82069.1 hypothetical protein CEUSTIGMA_g9497.t1 [Chlamydomonas eustigma]